MAGSLNHIVGSDGRFRMDLSENMGDADEALEECFQLIGYLSGWNHDVLTSACQSCGFPATKPMIEGRNRSKDEPSYEARRQRQGRNTP